MDTLYWCKIFKVPPMQKKHHMIGVSIKYVSKHQATNRKVAGLIPDEVKFIIYLILMAPLGSGVYSASSRNEYQKH
jgi:hypothetical protein